MTSKPAVYIAAAIRTPMGGLLGELSSVPAPSLGASAIRALLSQSSLGADAVEEVLMGCVLPAGLGQAPARQAALQAGLPTSSYCTTVNKVCGSGMKTVMLAFDQIIAGSCQVAIAGGMENMSQAPFLMTGARQGYKAGHQSMYDHMFLDALEDPNSGSAMGSFAQAIANTYNITREAMDDYAISSLTRAQQAIKAGWFDTEVTPVTISNRNGEQQISVDEQPGKARLEKIPQLKPAFAKDGTITAANASSISDGAAALLLCSNTALAQHQLKPIARIVAHSSHALEPENFPIAPIGAIEKVLHKAGWDINDVDVFEVNEAFAVVAMLAMQELNIPHNKMNLHGGACALGHPVGASGARIIVTLINILKKLGKQRGIASICIGGGEATAIAIECL